MPLTEKEPKNWILWVGIAIIIFLPLILVISYFIQNKNLNGIQDWLIPVSSFELLITAAIGSWVTVNNYTLKIEKERRLSDSSTVESNVRLLKLFSEMMQIANSRYDPILSEKVIEGLFNKGLITAKDYENEENLKLASKKMQTAIITPSYGLAAQESAIAAIYSLGRDHPILLDAAIDGLSALKLSFIGDSPHTNEILKKTFAEEVKKIEKYLIELNEVKEQKKLENT